MAAISITAANVLASNQAIKDVSHNAGAAITRGATVYLDATFLWQLGSATTSATTAATRGIALNDATVGQPLAVVLSDPAFTPGGALVAGVAVVTGLAGAINPITDVATGWFTNYLGMPTSTTQMVLAPSGGALAHA